MLITHRLVTNILQDRVDPLKIQALAGLGKIQFCLSWTESHKGSNPGKISSVSPSPTRACIQSGDT